MPPKTADCGAGEARNYLAKARGFLDAARLFADNDADVAASNAVHAAITAADAICCARLGRRSRDADHSRAVELLALVDRDAAKWLQQAVAARHRAQYDDRPISVAESRRAVRAAEKLVDRALTLAS
jgi:uncharacterized protein (UPF0332 family)